MAINETETEIREKIQRAALGFIQTELSTAAANLWGALGYRSDKQLDLPSAPKDFFATLEQGRALNRDKACLDSWKSAHFLFQLTNDEIPGLAYVQATLDIGDKSYRKGMIESFVFLAIELAEKPVENTSLEGGNWTRTQLAGIARELNLAFPMPAIVLFKHGARVSIAIIDRRINKRDATKDVLDKRRIAIIKDIDCTRPHRAHLEILTDLAFTRLGDRHTPSSFRDLYEAWLKVLSVQELNKRFYNELLTWFLWAVREAVFPQGQVGSASGQSPVAVIRLLTRLIFVWFIKEKGIVPDALFQEERLRALLKEPPATHPDSCSYYKAILQNLFFATLNTEQADRRWKAGAKGLNSHYLVHSVYRYRNQFLAPEEAFTLFNQIPFLNGGLFECLDREVTERDLTRNADLEKLVEKEGNGYVLRVDGFSDRSVNRLNVPNRLFFSEGEEIDLNAELGTKNKTRTARGLIDIFSRYKFTIEENTPLEEEVALDPELLGKVFENLLASYNEDTKETARKNSGSFYTPREVVDYMVDEALMAYFETKLSYRTSEAASETQLEASSEAETVAERESEEANSETDIQERLRQLLAFGNQMPAFSETEITMLIMAIENLRSLDPACGSGAFLMGMLQKLVYVLKCLDPDNTLWKTQNRVPLEQQLASATSIPDPTLRETKTEEAQEALEKLDRAFSNRHYAEYSRKLYLIEKCLFGVDIQPIAVQIAKLRFFISLVVSQKVDRSAENLNITALPNLETKLVAADSLLPIERPDQGTLRDTQIDRKEDELRLANERHFAARTTKTKRKWRDRITALRDELALLLEQDQMLTKASAAQVVQWDPFDQSASAKFFDPEWMFGLRGGFDLVIGNPPYVRHERIQAQKPDFKRIYACYTGIADLYVYFYERSIRLLKPGGAFAFITSNRWYRVNYGEKLRDWMNRNTLLHRIIDFGDAPIFDALAYPTIVIATRRSQPVQVPQKQDRVLALKWKAGMPADAFPQVFAEQAFPVPQSELKSTGWQLEISAKRDLLARINNVGSRLGSWYKFYRGVTTGCNDAFIISGREKDEIVNKNPDSKVIIKPYIYGRDIKRWHLDFQNEWIIFTRKGTDIEAHAAIKQHLETFKSELIPKPSNWPDDTHWEGRKPGNYQWYEIQDDTAYWLEFEQPKIVFPDIALSPQFAFDDGRHYVANTGYIIPRAQPWLLGILNSSTTAWFYAQISPQIMNGYFRFIKQYVESIRIPEVESKQQLLLESLVGVMRDCPVRYSSSWGSLINGFVYELFFLNDLHDAHIHLFAEAEKAGVARLAGLQGEALAREAEQIADTIFRNDHPIYRMLFDLQGLDAVRIIEGKA